MIDRIQVRITVGLFRNYGFPVLFWEKWYSMIA